MGNDGGFVYQLRAGIVSGPVPVEGCSCIGRGGVLTPRAAAAASGAKSVRRWRRRLTQIVSAGRFASRANGAADAASAG